MPPVTRRGYKNEFKHEVKSDPHSLQGRRPRCHRPVRVNASNFQVCSLLPQVSAPRPQSPSAVASIVRSGSTVFHLSSSAPPRLCASQGPFRSAPSSLRFPPRSRRASSPWPRSSDRGAPYLIYPAQRHRASARAKALYGALIHATFRSAPSSLRFPPRSRRASPPWPRSSDRGARYFIYPAQRHRASARAKALYGALIDATFRSALSSLRFPPRPPQCQHPWPLFLFSNVFPLRFSVFLCLNIVANESAFYTFIINENRRYS